MDSRKLVPDARSLRCDDISVSHGVVTLNVTSIRITASCPLCGTKSKRVHSRYWRALSDLPVSGMQVAIRWRSRRFFCVRPSCERRIFTERLDKVAPAKGRRTARLNSVLQSIASTCGGESGARLADRIGIAISADTMLREVHRADPIKPSVVRVVGVDDWAWRKGQRYGTILIDLERHSPIDLLPDRSAESFSEWLKSHPGVEIISRDRGDYYIKGATCGAPHAQQVADRFHLVKNLREAIKRLLDRHPSEAFAATRAVAQKHQATIIASPKSRPARKEESPRQSAAEPKSRRRLAYDNVMTLNKDGHSRREIARRLGMHRSTVARYIDAESFPERASRVYASAVDPFSDYLWQRWQEGIHNARRLAEEIRQRGFAGSYLIVRRFVSAWRNGESNSRENSPRVRRPSSQRLSGLFVAKAENMSALDVQLLKELKRQCPAAKTAARVATQFLKMLREHGSEPLDRWIRRVSADEMPKELRGFAKGIKKDLAAVRNALDLHWSNGPTEGFVNRLKMLKRQMYGRAGFSLLRKRFLAAA